MVNLKAILYLEPKDRRLNQILRGRLRGKKPRPERQMLSSETTTSDSIPSPTLSSQTTPHERLTASPSGSVGSMTSSQGSTTSAPFKFIQRAIIASRTRESSRYNFKAVLHNNRYLVRSEKRLPNNLSEETFVACPHMREGPSWGQIHLLRCLPGLVPLQMCQPNSRTGNQNTGSVLHAKSTELITNFWIWNQNLETWHEQSVFLQLLIQMLQRSPKPKCLLLNRKQLIAK